MDSIIAMVLSTEREGYLMKKAQNGGVEVRKENEPSEAELHKWIVLLEKKKKDKKRYILYFISITIGVFLLCLLFYWGWRNSFASYNQRQGNFFIGDSLLIFISISVLTGITGFFAIHVNYSNRIERYESQIIEKETTEIKEDLQGDFFNSLIRLSYNYLDKYYNQTGIQANKSFKVTLGVSIAGAVVIAAGIVLMFIGKTDPAYVTVAAGVISEFIAAVFFYLYNSTIKSMSKYHNKLVLSQNVSIALRVAEDLPEKEQTEVKAEMSKLLVQDINQYIVMEKE